MTRRHFVIACRGLGHGGAVANVAYRHAGLLGRDADVSLLSDGFPEGRQEGVGRVRCPSPDFHGLRRFGHVPREWAFARAVGRRLEGIAGERHIDAVMCHGHVVAALAAARLKRRRGVPYVLVTHGDIFERPRGTYDPWLTAFYKAVTPPAYRQADLVLALSPRMGDLARRWVGGDVPVEVLPNGIALDEISSAPGEAPRLYAGVGLKILFVGRLSIEKGVEHLIEAVGRMRDRDIPCELAVIGDGPLGEGLRALAAERGLDGVRFLGRRPRAELHGCYRQADVVCVPSLSDPLPTVVLEAMAAGRPVVGTDVGGIPFMVEHRRTGLVVEPRSAPALAEALGWLAERPEAVRALGAAAARRARDVFSWEAIGDRLRGLMDRIPSNGVGPR